MPKTAVAVAEPAHLQDLPAGWFNHGAQVLALLEQAKPRVCVELGTWLGQSAIAIARSIRRWGGTLTCVDTWMGEVDQPLGSRVGPPLMLMSCGRYLVESGVSASVRLIPATTTEASRYWTTPIDFLYVDADHSYGSVLADLDAWVPHVRPGGLIVGDDYDNPAYPGVRAAWDDFAQAQGLTLTRYQSDPPNPHGVALIYGETHG